MSSPTKNVALKYLDTINDANSHLDATASPSKSPLQPTSKFNSSNGRLKKSYPEEDLDKLAMQLNVNPISTPTKNELLRTKFETPSVTVSSFKTPLNISSSSTVSSTKSGSPIRRPLGNRHSPYKTNDNSTEPDVSPIKRGMPSLKYKQQEYDSTDSRPNKSYLSSPSNSTDKNSPGYEYLCRIMAIKLWLEDIIEESIDKTPCELITEIRNGIVLAKLANVILPTKRPVFTNSKLQFRHTENINRFFKLLDFMDVPDLFRFELTDLYDARNVPKVWFCLHAMSYMLHKSDPNFPQIENLVDKVDFSPDDIKSANRSLVGCGLPNFASADEDDNGAGESTYMNRALETGSPNKLERASPSRTHDQYSNNNRDSSIYSSSNFDYQTPKKKPSRNYNTYENTSVNKSSQEDNFYTPKSQILSRPSYLDNTNYKESPYYTPEIENHLSNIMKLQALSRGASFRYRMFVKKIMLKSYNDEITQMNSLIRGSFTRMKTVHRHRDEILVFKHEIVDLQSIIRSKSLRAGCQYDFSSHIPRVTRLQSIIRGKLQRDEVKKIKFGLVNQELKLTEFQAYSKMFLIYSKSIVLLKHKTEIEPQIVEVQSLVRRALYKRNTINSLLSGLKSNGNLSHLQAVIRGKLTRKNVFTKQFLLSKVSPEILELQSVARGGVARTRLCNNVLITLMHEDITMNCLFAKARGNFVRDEMEFKHQYLKYYEKNVIKLQSLFRGVLCRFERDIILEDSYDNIDQIISFQSIIRGGFLRNKLNSIDAYYHQNISMVIRAQAILKRNFTQRAYKSLISMKDPPLSVIRRFAYLLSDNDRDYEQEMELSELKDKIIDKSKANEELEKEIDNLDVKLGLLDKNKITVEDFIKNRTKSKHVKEISDEKNTMNFERLNKSSRERIELYQSLFYFLQTKPSYLVRLHEHMDISTKSQREFGQLQTNILSMYPIKDSSIHHHSREEFFLVKFILALMANDVKQNCTNLTDITKSNCCFWIDYLLHFNSHTYQRLHLKSMLGKVVTSIVDDDEADFESDPSVIYLEFVQRDMRIDGFSDRNNDITPQMAIKDPEVSTKFVQNLMNLREHATSALNYLETMYDRIPLHVKLIAKEAYKLSKLSFPDRSETNHLSVAGVVFIKHYISSIFLYPENFGLAIKDPFNPGLSNAKAKTNLKYLSKVLMQVFALKPFSDNFMKPLNDYVTSSFDIAKDLISEIIKVEDLETEYKFTDYDDIVTHDRPKLVIKVNDMIQLEKTIQRNIDIVAPSSDDQLYSIATSLNETVSSSDDMVALSELGLITLSLNPTTKEESIAETKGNALFTQVKRSVLYIIRVQDGSDLLELLVGAITSDHEQAFQEITHSERQEAEDDNAIKKKKAYHKTSLGDLTSIDYRALKKNALETILQLEVMGLVSRRDCFQEILNQIALDIKTKHQQRVTRKTQLDVAITTYDKLIEKEIFLTKQHQDYSSHVETILAELQLKPKDKRFFNIIPIFSKQYFYHRELRKSNRLPKFGSYKYSAKKLMEQKILIDLGGSIHQKHGSSSKLDFMFSCHEAGKFTVEAANGTVNLPGAYSTISLDDLLNLQYEKKEKIEVFDGMVVFDTMNLASFIFKRFYDINKD